MIRKENILLWEMRNKKWGDRWGSNPRQPESQSGTLPAELRPPKKQPDIIHQKITHLKGVFLTKISLYRVAQSTIILCLPAPQF